MIRWLREYFDNFRYDKRYRVVSKQAPKEYDMWGNLVDKRRVKPPKVPLSPRERRIFLETFEKRWDLLTKRHERQMERRLRYIPKWLKDE